MATLKMEILALTVALTAALCIGPNLTTAQLSSGCTNVIISLSPCLNYITGNSSEPSSSCCSQLASVVKSQQQCLCQAISAGGGSAAMGLNINQTQALALPGACNVQTSISSCKNGTSSPSGSPSTSPSPSTGLSGTGSSTGSRTLPSPQVDSSDGHTFKSTQLAPLLALFFTGHTVWDVLF